MNNFTPRQQFILNKVLNEGPFNIKGLHKQLNISTRTILREISSINKSLKKYSVNIFNDEDMNLSLSGNKDKIEEIKVSLNQVPMQWLFNKEQRQIIIACELLVTKEPIKASYFSHKFNVVMGSISLDLDSIENMVLTKNLCLIRKRSHGISIEGSEWNKRIALVELLFELKPYEDLLPILYDEKVDQTVKAFFEIIFGTKIINLVRETFQESKFSYIKVNDVKYFSLFIQILLSIKKTENGDNIELPEKIKKEIQSLDVYEKLKNINETLIENNINLPEDELVYLSLYLSEYNYFLNSNGNFTQSDINYEDLALELVTEVSKKIQVDLMNDIQLIRDLSQHLKQTFYMLNLGLVVINPLISEIKEHYTDLFKVINNKCKLIFSRYNLKIPLEEVGYITMHIDVALQRQQAFLRKIKTMVVCPGGIATARILCNKIQALFPDIGNLAITSINDVSRRLEEESFDLILSTVPINLSIKNKVIVVSPFMTKENIEKVNSFIFDFKLDNQVKLVQLPSSLDDDEVTNSEYELANTILKNFQLKKTKVDSFADLINFIVEDIYEIDLTHDKNAIINGILKREEKGNVVVPGSGIALIHTRCDEMVTPFVGVYRVEDPIRMSSIGFSTEEVGTFLVLLARQNESNYILQLLGKISVSLIEQKEFVETLKIGSITDIRNNLINIVNKEEDN
ncbi:BglG family transcription antiterminator [Clostridium sp. 'White wine YQ']|uniref:BglG family transcription antiterminator n=1 Tax=Clostridium sp. 'White wine YQ' TaxID=3027474 RepID=UPI002365762B|nr:BglG family transcription antiterminator [Clostridium sp. 'White wine YQ']MDD7795923.1 BglG family transcription antiterminator [Clostridium sp. 'White wine YQ']